jgi:hypothetical protein
MPLPFSFSGRVEIREQHDAKHAASSIERALEVLKVKRIIRVGPRNQFTTGMFRLVSSHNLLVAVRSDEFSVEPTERTYCQISTPVHTDAIGGVCDSTRIHRPSYAERTQSDSSPGSRRCDGGLAVAIWRQRHSCPHQISAVDSANS